MPKSSGSLARINIDFHNVSVLSVYKRLYIAPYHKQLICTDKILKEIALLVCKNAKFSTSLAPLARINRDFHNVSALSVYRSVYIAPYQGNCLQV